MTTVYSLQIGELDDRLQQTQADLREKTLQFQQVEQVSNKQQMELHAKTAKLQELQTVNLLMFNSFLASGDFCHLL